MVLELLDLYMKINISFVWWLMLVISALGRWRRDPQLRAQGHVRLHSERLHSHHGQYEFISENEVHKKLRNNQKAGKSFLVSERGRVSKRAAVWVLKETWTGDASAASWASVLWECLLTGRYGLDSRKILALAGCLLSLFRVWKATNKP